MPPATGPVSTTVSRGQSLTYGYNAANRMTSYGWWRYSYNGDGLRTSKYNSQPGPPPPRPGAAPDLLIVTQFTWDVNEPLPELLSDGATRYIYGPGGMLLEQVQAGTPDHYHADRQGSVRALSDANGARQATYQYDAYGNTTASTGSLANPFRYAGGYQDKESVLTTSRRATTTPAPSSS